MDGEYYADLQRLAGFAEDLFDNLPRGGGRRQKEDSRKKALWRIEHEIKEILNLYNEFPDEKFTVNGYPSTGGGKRVIRGVSSFS